jgi:hypothetical protein
MKDLQIVLSLTASTMDELSTMTVRAQINWGMKLQFFDFTQLKNGNFICWFHLPHSVWAEKVLNGKT